MKVVQVLLFAGKFILIISIKCLYQNDNNNLIVADHSADFLSCQRCCRWASQIGSKASSSRGKWDSKRMI